MKIEYIVMEGNPRGTQEPFNCLSVENNFTTQGAAEAAIETYFETNKLGSAPFLFQPILFVLKVFKGN